MNLAQTLEARLELRKAKGLFRSLTPVGAPGIRIQVQGQEMISFSSNDYLGLSQHPAVIAGAQTACETYGGSSASSRLVAGDYPLLDALEGELADFLGYEAALVFGSGYQANVGLMASLPQRGEVILSDALNHASIIDGCRLSRATIQILEHNRPEALKAQLEAGVGDYYITESLFSMDGDPADLATLHALCQAHDIPMIVDEAHAFGIFGVDGRGLGSDLSTLPDIMIGTCGKSLGSFGAFVAGPRALKSYLVNQARSLIYTTAPPPAVVGATLAALRLIRRDDSHRQCLLRNIEHMHRGLKTLGINTLGSTSHIIPLITGDPHRGIALAEGLQRRGYYAKVIRPPTVPPGTSRVRLTLSAAHEIHELDGLLEAIEAEMKG